MLLARLGERLRLLREASGLTQQRLADVLSVRPATVSELEAGRVAPTVTTLAAFARVLRVRLAVVVDVDAPIDASAAAEAVEHELLRRWRRLSPSRQDVVLAVIRELV